MTVHPMPPVPKEIAERIAKLVERGMDQQQVIIEMRTAGLHIVDCMRLIRDLYKIDQRDAKSVVHESIAWASMRGEYDAFHDKVEAAALKAGFEVDEVAKELQKAS